MNSYHRQSVKLCETIYHPQRYSRSLLTDAKSVSYNQTVHRTLRNEPAFDSPKSSPPRRKPEWLIQKEAIKNAFPTGWNPPKKLSRPAMALLKSLHKEDSHQFSLPILADKFKISPEAVRRILKSHWKPDETTTEKLLRKSNSIGSNTGSDAWIRHERLETDSIPTNLASSLRESMGPSKSNKVEKFKHSSEFQQGIWVDPDIRTDTSRLVRREEEKL
ncbi:hypothetical protein CROQUDRAFT_380923 [Cronartium quercuum f. sp. fusiforme G11]|uniref:Required for respiratory growth protein 9, mitochondrial n=1 Tax=Cronartium quercuum f. sp. fusiforme G11 TaxID=708437 RepID=A0A9P6NAH3_9BASI|nr:hypothetical protein CROQUDRAFT_380923 [Cronartium quercuum f. sp. fusiforme G11]